MNASKLRRLFLIAALAAAVTTTAAQLRVDVQLVNIVATVTDINGRYVANLKKEDFVLEEDGKVQELVHMTQDHDVPVSVGVVLDTSGSMENKIRTATDAVDRFIRTIHEEDEIFFLTFAAQPTLRQDFTDDRQRLSRALRSVRVGGGTALYDAVVDGVDKAAQGKHDKRALLLITDGEDTSSRTPLSEAESAVRQSELLVYALGISPASLGNREPRIPQISLPPIIIGGGGAGRNGGGFPWPSPGGNRRPNPGSSKDTVDMQVLEAFADASGGRAYLLEDSWFTGRSAQVDRVLNQIADELRSQYTLGFYPSHGMDGKWHSLRVRTKPGLQVRARRGYTAN